MSDLDPQTCFCGLPLHYKSESDRKRVQALVDDLGRFVKVTVGSESWMVDRHYIAIHGIKGAELDSLGFEKVA